MTTESANMAKGRRGEQHALRYLLGMGFVRLAENWRSGRQEIDLIMLDGPVLVFAEVKWRSARGFGQPEEFIDEDKRENVRLAAEEWMLLHAWDGRVRFDIVAVVEAGGIMEITHFTDAF